MPTITKIIHIILFVVIFWSCSHFSINTSSYNKYPTDSAEIVNTGLDILLENNIDRLNGKNIALVTNHSGIDKNGNTNIAQLYVKTAVQIETIFTPERDVSQQGTSNSNDTRIAKIFSPEHGFSGNIQRGEHVNDDSSLSDIPPVISLYGKIRKPTKQMLSNIDLIIYDIQDIGARFYTYISTLGLVMEAAAEANIPVMILDRPNPIGNKVEGPILDKNFKSFIGQYPIPIRYGMTVGELAKLIIGEKMINPIPELTVIPMKNYSRDYFYDRTFLPWVNPSPNIPNLETAIIYPGFCLFEATNVSEGRGTYTPFKQIGAPWIDASSLISLLNKQNLPGVIFKPTQFTPVSIATMSKYPKFENIQCNGMEINIINRDDYNSVLTGVTFLWAINKLYPNEFIINKESMGRLWGSDQLVTQLKEGSTPIEIIDSYQDDISYFHEIRKKYLIY